MNSAKIISIAKQYVGLKECVPNAKWTSKLLENADILSSQLCGLMEVCGWEKGWPYCMAFAKAVHLEAFKADQAKVKQIQKVLSSSVMNSYYAAQKAGLVSKIPKPGCIFIMQNGSGGNGHAGIVESISGNVLHTIEGNTSPAPSSTEADRNGDGIYAKTRKLDFTIAKGLHLIGFIHLI